MVRLTIRMSPKGDKDKSVNVDLNATVAQQERRCAASGCISLSSRSDTLRFSLLTSARSDASL